MRVVLATHRTNQWLGVNKYFYLLGKYLARLGVQVRFVVDSMKGIEAIKEICNSSENIEIVKLSPTATNPVSTLVYCDVLSSYLVNHKDFDILHCGHILPYLYLLSGKLLKVERKPVIFQPFGNELFTLAGRGINKWYCKLAQPILRYCGEHADVLLSEGAFQNKEMKRYYPKAKRLAVLPVGVDINAFKPKEKHSADKPFQFLAVNSLLPYEGMDDLLGAFRLVNGRCSLVIVGTGSEEGKLKGMARWLRVVFKKNLPESELHDLYRESDAFVCPTHETDFQMGVLEAMAMGLPVLCREAPWLPNPVMSFSADSSDFEERMFCLASTSALKRSEMGNRGIEEAQQYSFTNIAEKAVKIYEELLHNNFT